MSTIPAGSLVLLVGPSGAGKSTWVDARGDLPATAIVSSDRLREQLYDTDTVQRGNATVFALLHQLAEARLAAGHTTVVDATNLKPGDRKPLYELAARQHAATVAVRFDVPTAQLQARNASRPHPRPDRILDRHAATMASAATAKVLAREVDHVVDHDQPIRFAPYATDVRHLDSDGPVAVVGDVHGHAGLLAGLLAELDRRWPQVPLIFVGDIGDKGPDSPGCYRQVLDRLAAGGQLVASNHGRALAEKVGRLLADGDGDLTQVAATLAGRAAAAAAAGQRTIMPRLLAATVDQFAAAADGLGLLDAAVAAERRAPYQLLVGDGTVVVHGGVRADLLGVRSGEARQVALYGTPTGADEATGLPTGRDSWVEAYLTTVGPLPTVVYGHIGYPSARVTARTVGVDTSAAGHLTAAVVADGRLCDLVSC